MYNICIVGLGYVWLPLAVKFAKYFKVVGFDINEERVDQLKNRFDRNLEVKKEDFAEIEKNIIFTTNSENIRDCNIIIISVPTPVKKDKTPDLYPLESSSEIVGKNLKKGSIIVYESTTYPGCTEEFCVPILEKFSNLRCGSDFFVGYSPERVNPGDKEHNLGTITKIVAWQNEAVVKTLEEVYGKTTKVYKATSIRVAEAAKVIENTQRDINIALMNELAMLFERMDINSKEVFDAASTKWNFLRFYPGFVGGHCIPVDPYYLAHKAMDLNFYLELILAGRKVNESTPNFIAQKIVKLLINNQKNIKKSRILIMGATYKENVPDLRDSKVENLVVLNM
ncbi:putative UDP-glucose/GDP-mannose dehydrogenase (fragment) [groundwater metagenome]|uniref:Putative UDP-glucose/GDP-mannose dehydrogenase n=1 Tax=groundwater metagenome TaxID=717931 RepID=A0A098EED1_9ZZZZ